MSDTVAIVAPGNMGAAVAARLAANGIEVWTTLDGRGAASRERASGAGMIAVPMSRLVEAPMVLSIVPPGVALSFAEEVASVVREGAARPLYVDCNAVSPSTVAAIEQIITATGASFADAGIVGAPPQPGTAGPRFYVSGEQAAAVAALGACGLDVRVLDGPVGAASALKMCFAGINKGLIALASAMILAATRSGAAAALRRELAENEQALFDSLSHKVPAMVPRAWRWVAEMDEIGEFAGDDPAARLFFEGAAQMYEAIARDAAASGEKSADLRRFFAGGRDARVNRAGGK
jgi:3-hydroxyisobutyrate dehydrogenase-like beta-hydroxyacid dehydrogenase